MNELPIIILFKNKAQTPNYNLIKIIKININL